MSTCWRYLIFFSRSVQLHCYCESAFNAPPLGIDNKLSPELHSDSRGMWSKTCKTLVTGAEWSTNATDFGKRPARNDTTWEIQVANQNHEVFNLANGICGFKTTVGVLISQCYSSSPEVQKVSCQPLWNTNSNSQRIRNKAILLCDNQIQRLFVLYLRARLQLRNSQQLLIIDHNR